jgi:hypothetical protein
MRLIHLSALRSVIRNNRRDLIFLIIVARFLAVALRLLRRRSITPELFDPADAADHLDSSAELERRSFEGNLDLQIELCLSRLQAHNIALCLDNASRNIDRRRSRLVLVSRQRGGEHRKRGISTAFPKLDSAAKHETVGLHLNSSSQTLVEFARFEPAPGSYPICANTPTATI